MTTRMFLLVWIALVLSLPTNAQQIPLQAIDGSTVVVDKGWKLLRAFLSNGTSGNVSVIYTYQTSTVVKTAPRTLKFWAKTKDYREAEKDYQLNLYEVRCGKREIRALKLMTYFKKKPSESLANPDRSFEDIEPDGLFDMLYLAVCTDHDIP